MSKQSDNKTKQGWDTTPILPICGNCKYEVHSIGTWNERKKMHCTLGNFATRTTATCKCYEQA